MIALVLVAHSPELVHGLAEMVRQGAPQVLLVAAAGTATGALGTSAVTVEEALRSALAAADGAVVLLDLNSAALAVEMALEELDPDELNLIRVSRGPLVEGALAAAASAAGGAPLAAVLAASESPLPKLPADWPADGRSPAAAAPAPSPDEGRPGPAADAQSAGPPDGALQRDERR